MSARPLRAVALLAIGLWASPPGGASAATTAAGAAASPSESRVPVPAVRTLANGLTVAVFSDDRLPLVQIQLLVAAGSVHEPAGEPGVANLTLHMLTHGTASRTPQAFAGAVQALGGTIGVSTGRDFATLNGAFLASDFEAGLELLADAALHPVFREDELAAVKDRTVAEIRDAHQNAARSAEDHAWATVFADHPYGRSPLGALRTIPGLGVAQLREFHRDRYRPNVALLAVAGDVAPERAFQAVEDAFGAWGGRAAESPLGAPPPHAGWHVRIVDVPDLGQAALRFSTAGPARGAADYEAMRVATDLLRAASAENGFEATTIGLKSGGFFSIAAAVPVDSVGAEVARVRKALSHWSTVPPAEPALAATRRHLVGRFPLQFETFDGVIATWMAAAACGLPAGAIAAEPGQLGAVSAKEVVAAAAHWVTPSSMSLVVLGPAKRLRPQLERIGTIEVVSTEVLADAVETPSTATAPPTRLQLARGREIAALAVAAHGGLARLRRIQDSSLEGDVRMSLGPKDLAGQMVQIRKQPRRFLFSTTLPGMRTIQMLEDDRAWASSGPGSTPEESDSMTTAALRSGFSSDLQHLLLAAADSSSRVAWRGREFVKDREADVIEVLDRAGERRVLFVGAGDHRLMAMEQNDHEHSARRVYGDLRDVDGVLWPFLEERLLDGQRTMTFTLRRVTLNTGVKDEAFHPPPSDTRPRPR